MNQALGRMWKISRHHNVFFQYINKSHMTYLCIRGVYVITSVDKGLLPWDSEWWESMITFNDIGQKIPYVMVTYCFSCNSVITFIQVDEQ